MVTRLLPETIPVEDSGPICYRVFFFFFKFYSLFKCHMFDKTINIHT